MISLAVNGRCLSRRVTGVERYSREILRCLPSGTRPIHPWREMPGIWSHAWEQFILPTRLRSGEILWSPANTGPLLVNRQVLTLHDLSWLEHPEWFAPAFALWYRCLIPRLLRRVEHITVPSRYVREKVVRSFSIPPQRVTVVPGGVDRVRFHPRNRPSGRVPVRYVLFTGTLQPRKNLSVLVQAWKEAQQDFPDTWLLIAGAGRHNFRSAAWAAKAACVHFTGYVPDDDLPGLYAGALACVCPSLDEGFCLPALEAMASGTPVISSVAGALPEVIGDAGLFFDPAQPIELAHALRRCLSSTEMRARLAEKGLARSQAYPWQSSAEKMWGVMQSCR